MRFLPPILVLDVEATAPDPEVATLLEIGMCKITQDLRIKKVFQAVIQQKDFDEECWIFENSDLTPEMVRKGIDLEEIREEVQTLLNSHVVIAYNQHYDFTILRRYGFTITRTTNDPMFLMTDICKIERDWGYKWPKVQECLDYLQIKAIEPHRAQADACLEAQIIVYLIKNEFYGDLYNTKYLCSNSEEKTLRWLAKRESYEHLLDEIRNLSDVIEVQTAITEKIGYLNKLLKVRA